MVWNDYMIRDYSVWVFGVPSKDARLVNDGSLQMQKNLLIRSLQNCMGHKTDC